MRLNVFVNIEFTHFTTYVLFFCITFYKHICGFHNGRYYHMYIIYSYYIYLQFSGYTRCCCYYTGVCRARSAID